MKPDPFTSGGWTGYYRYGWIMFRRKETMRLTLHFREGRVEGEGQDPVGWFEISGVYSSSTGEFRFVKTYPGKHSVDYSGQPSGASLRGRWQIQGDWGGDFNIWPESSQTQDLQAGLPGIHRP